MRSLPLRLMLEVFPNLVGTVADIVYGLPLLILSHAEAFRPIAPTPVRHLAFSVYGGHKARDGTSVRA